MVLPPHKSRSRDDRTDSGSIGRSNLESRVILTGSITQASPLADSTFTRALLSRISSSISAIFLPHSTLVHDIVALRCAFIAAFSVSRRLGNSSSSARPHHGCGTSAEFATSDSLIGWTEACHRSRSGCPPVSCRLYSSASLLLEIAFSSSKTNTRP